MLVNVPFAGSYISAVAREAVFAPPAIRTLPLNKEAVWEYRDTVIDWATAVKPPVAGL